MLEFVAMFVPLWGVFGVLRIVQLTISNVCSTFYIRLETTAAILISVQAILGLIWSH